MPLTVFLHSAAASNHRPGPGGLGQALARTPTRRPRSSWVDLDLGDLGEGLVPRSLTLPRYLSRVPGHDAKLAALVAVGGHAASAGRIAGPRR